MKLWWLRIQRRICLFEIELALSVGTDREAVWEIYAALHKLEIEIGKHETLCQNDAALDAPRSDNRTLGPGAEYS